MHNTVEPSNIYTYQRQAGHPDWSGTKPGWSKCSQSVDHSRLHYLKGERRKVEPSVAHQGLGGVEKAIHIGTNYAILVDGKVPIVWIGQQQATGGHPWNKKCLPAVLVGEDHFFTNSGAQVLEVIMA